MVWGGLIQLGHPSTLHRPTDWQFQLFKGAEVEQMVTEVIRPTKFVIWILQGAGIVWRQDAGQKELGASTPTVFQRDILDNLFNAVRITRDNRQVEQGWCPAHNNSRFSDIYNQVHTNMNNSYTRMY